MKKIHKTFLLATLFLLPALVLAATTVPWVTTNNTGIFPNTINGTTPKVGIGLTTPLSALSAAGTIQTTTGDITIGSLLGAFGDSITVGTGGTVPTVNGYAYLVTAAKGLTFTNHAVNGTQAADGADLVLAENVATTSSYIYAFGANDERQYSSDLQLQAFQKIDLEEMAWLAIPDYKKIRGNDTTNIHYTGSWSTPGGFGGIGHTSATNNDTATTSVFGSSIILSSSAFGPSFGDTGTFTVAVDGVGTTTYSANFGAEITTLNGRFYAPYAVIIPNLSLAQHIVTFTVTSNQNVYLNWVAGITGSDFQAGPFVYAGNVIRQKSSQYAGNGGSDANVTKFNKIIKDNVSYLASLGLNVAQVDSSSVIDPTSSDLGADGLHPSDTGYNKMANAFLAVMTGGAKPRERATSNGIPNIVWSPTSLSLQIQNGLTYSDALTIGSTGNIGIGSTSPYVKLGVAGTLVADNFIATSTTATSTFASAITVGAGQGTSTFANGISALQIALTSGTSTATKGWNLTGGCFAISGACIGSSGGSGTVNSGTIGQVPYYAAAGTTLTATSTLFLTTASAVGIGTVSPHSFAKVQINGNDSNKFDNLTLGNDGTSQLWAFDTESSGLLSILDRTGSNGRVVRVNTSGEWGFDGGISPGYTITVNSAATGALNLVAASGGVPMNFTNNSDAGMGVSVTAPGVADKFFAFRTLGDLAFFDNSGNEYGRLKLNNMGKFLWGASTTPWAQFGVVDAGIGAATTSPMFIVATSTSYWGVDRNAHVITKGTAPSVSSCGATPSPSISGNDTHGTVTTGGGVVTACTVTFAKPYDSTPTVVISDDSTGVTGDISAVSSTAFTVSFSASLSGGHIYYIVQN